MARTRVKFVGGGSVVVEASAKETRAAIEEGLRSRRLVELMTTTKVKHVFNPFVVAMIESVPTT